VTEEQHDDPSPPRRPRRDHGATGAFTPDSSLKVKADRSWALMAAFGMGGFVVGLVVFFFEPVIHAGGNLAGVSVSRAFTKEELGFVERDQTALWLFLLCAQAALWAALLVPLTNALRALGKWRNRTPAVWGSLALLMGYVALVLPGLVTRDPSYPFPAHEAKLTVFKLLAVPTVYVCALAMWRVKQIAEDAMGVQGDEVDAMERYLALRRTLGRLLAYMGALLSPAVLSGGALRNAVVTWTHAQATSASNSSAADAYPFERLLSWGLGLTLLLVVIYVPPYQRVRALGVMLPPDSGWRVRAEERAALGKLLSLDLSVSRSLGVSAAVLAPLTSALVGGMLGAG
jgi:hypothetical protein